MKLLRSVLVLALFLFALDAANAADVVNLDLNATAREYCRVLRFPAGWKMPIYFEPDGFHVVPLSKFALSDDFEFRVPGLQGTKFLVRGVEKLSSKYYTSNIYEADFADPSGAAQPVGEEQWNSGTPVPWHVREQARDLLTKIKSLGFAFKPTGRDESEVRLSPDSGAIIVQSYSGTLGRCGGDDIPLGVFPTCIDIRGPHGKLFFDVYNTETGRKLITLTAKFSRIFPNEVFSRTGFVTERYFLIPLDEKREKCLICEFGRSR
jgi:hypothetical protein